MTGTSCCLGCTRRKVSCHSSCPTYKMYVEQRQKILAEQHKQNEFRDYVYENRRRTNGQS